jgi:hypothetical protein
MEPGEVYIPVALGRIFLVYLVVFSPAVVSLIAIQLRKGKVWNSEWLMVLAAFVAWYLLFRLSPMAKADGNFVFEPIILGLVLSACGIIRYRKRKLVTGYPNVIWRWPAFTIVVLALMPDLV